MGIRIVTKETPFAESLEQLGPMPKGFFPHPTLTGLITAILCVLCGASMQIIIVSAHAETALEAILVSVFSGSLFACAIIIPTTFFMAVRTLWRPSEAASEWLFILGVYLGLILISAIFLILLFLPVTLV